MDKRTQQTVDIGKGKNPPLAFKCGLERAIQRASELQLSYQNPEGYWWYTLEANTTIDCEYIMLMHFLDAVDPDVEEGLVNRILSQQRSDGAWSLYYADDGDLNATIECYFVLKLNGHDTEASHMVRARKYILSRGGLTSARVFTRIHFAMFGLVPWSSCPAMPLNFILIPNWMPVNIYEFSSWARASIVPMLVLMAEKPVKHLKENFNLEELYLESEEERSFQFTHDKSFLSWESFFIRFDKSLKVLLKAPFRPTKARAMRACEEWITNHIERTEDIYPALAYSAIALHLLGHPLDHPVLKKCLDGLKRFQHYYSGDLPALPNIKGKDHGVSKIETSPLPHFPTSELRIHQQCCISPVWDTPWSLTALLDAGTPADDSRLLDAGRWLISKQITDDIGDWKVKNPHGKPGGWSFEFQNDYFPDVDDTIQVIHVLNRLQLPLEEKEESMNLGLHWILSMQNDDGGWAAFDKNNKREFVNKIPFSDHGACLDPSSPDIAARVIGLLADFGFTREENIVRRAVDYISNTQTPFHAWSGRWGINYIYGTWAVLAGLRAIEYDMNQEMVQTAAHWLEQIQRSDGGWSESPDTYKFGKFEPYPESVPSQTAWALLGLMAARGAESDAVHRGADYLVKTLSDQGDWDEKYFTGTGFPGHFYIRYHGYRHFFPLMALGQYHRLKR